MFDAFGAPQYGLQDVKVATWNSTGSYATAVDIPSAQRVGGTINTQSGVLEGDDKITATASRAISGEVVLRFGSISLAALEVMVGNASAVSGTTPNAADTLTVSGGDNMPYFGIVGKALAEEGSGDTQVFYAKVKIMSDFQIAALAYGEFAIPEVTLTAIDDDTYGIAQVILHETAVAVAIPPTGAEDVS